MPTRRIFAVRFQSKEQDLMGRLLDLLVSSVVVLMYIAAGAVLGIVIWRLTWWIFLPPGGMRQSAFWTYLFYAACIGGVAGAVAGAWRQWRDGW